MKGVNGFNFDLGQKTSDGRTLTGYYLKKLASDAVTARSYQHSAANNGDSAALSLSWSTKGQLLQHSLKQAENNVLTDAKMLAYKWGSAWINLCDAIETALYTYLNANKTTTNSASTLSSRLGSWDSANYIWDILNDANSEKFFFQYMKQMLKVNHYTGQVDMVLDPILFAIAQQYAQQGQANATNTGFQFSEMNFIESVDIPAAEGYDGQLFAVIPGTVAMLTHVPAKNRENTMTKAYTYTTMPDPFGLGLVGAVHSYETGADTNGTGGALQDVTTQFELTVDYATAKAPLTTGTTIFKGGLKISGGA